MITTILNGGLGNQMFQYALGRNIAIKNNTDLCLKFNNSGDTIRNYSLNCFKLSPNVKVNLKTPKHSSSIFHSLSTFIHPFKWVIEKDFSFNPKVLTVLNDRYVVGYWQSEKYFINITPTIIQDFTLKKPLDNRNKQIETQIHISNSVSIHIRRGDYISNTKTGQFHGVCGLDYYQKAVSYIRRQVKKPVFFIFSDDIKWAIQNLKMTNQTIFIDWNKNNNSYKDMYLMSQCKHNIIANSSFSWWGAWLNQNTNKVVIAPKKWFNDSSINTKDLIPNSWIRI